MSFKLEAEDHTFLFFCGAPPMVLFFVSFLALSSAATIIAFSLAFMFGLVGCALWIQMARRKGENIRQRTTLAVSLLALSMSVMATDWPLRLNYLVSRAEIDRIAAQIDAGENVSFPRRVGLLQVMAAGKHGNGAVCLWTALDPAGKTGFVRCPKGDAGFNLWSVMSLDDRWQFITED